eukprot:snap_masked-scaffold_5-processed-gene-5.28-mRNA-1 protein AED:0.02 eAED:0.07 QI:0/-1/0/1/-1/1/1/0/239
MALCLSLSEPSFLLCKEKIKALVSKKKDNENLDFMIEIRADLIHEKGEGELTDSQVIELLSLCKVNGLKTIFTVRDLKRAETGFSIERLHLLHLGANNQASYVDLEYEAPKKYKEQVLQAAKESGCEVIVSYHNYEETPSTEELKELIDECYKFGGSIAKVATKALSKKDSSRLLSLYSEYEPGKVIILGMGEFGKISRVASIYLGSLLTFVAEDKTSLTAPGQLSIDGFIKITKEMDT